ncbi:MAG TPA: non-canonical purine NTP pyrophosphatase [Candidatus Dormibacteraeota bacterium]|nr:non-canonical purine NTP pyrophosphatase [Candidatus Dormibacteraeota bacterium]
MPRLIIATGNPGKLREFRELLADPSFELGACEPTEPENGATYQANARIKAEAASRATGLPALGDDSGLEVDALDGYPGLHSARIGPTQDERFRLVLERLRGVPRPWAARFVCALALAVPGRPTEDFWGVCEGEAIEPGEASGGFGYDPMFLLPDLGRTFAELDPEEKHRYSHRGAAVRALVASGALGALH